ncbi:MAG: S-methyl-5-thioribose-1-phosphate isomerase [Oscillibacter sp.]|nr:S-methyl-5-thioribose-1-phosphate isomerase [Oscillibacter sp.]MCI9001702.1 S-methyl-5-thioribose-1-phosphate isomerase [Oscillibacter sp.]
MKRADEGVGFLLRYENVAWYEDGAVRILDRRIYPVRVEYVTCRRHEEVAQAIADMVTQSGGPYLAAAMGMALAAYEAKDLPEADLLAHLDKAAYNLSHARPTTMAKMIRVTERAMNAAQAALAEGKTGSDLVEALRENAVNQINENYIRYTTIGKLLADKIPQNGTIMTQCFAETVIGTMLRECRERGNAIKVICPETRPYFQGARLTASVACDMGFDVTVISDNMPGYTMKEKHVDLFTSAADVITVDGHVINKVGTFQIALAARYWGIPYYVTGSPNPSHPDMSSVVIEERDPLLVMDAMGTRTTMEGVKGYYPAFDVTPPKLCDGVITEKGVFSPFDLKRYFES